MPDAGGPALLDVLKQTIVPALRGAGYRGSGRSFGRVVGEWGQAVNVQSRSDGNAIAINLGIDHVGFRPEANARLAPSELQATGCPFWWRLAEGDEIDQWWPFDRTSRSMHRAIEDALRVFRFVGQPTLDRMTSPSSPLLTVTPADLMSQDFRVLHFCATTNVRTALILSRLRRHQGDLADSRAFAVYALDNVGHGRSLIPELKRLAGVDAERR